MPAGISQVDLAGLGQTSQSQTQAVEEGRSQFQRLVNEGEALSATWLGQASAAFGTALDGLNTGGNQLFNALQTMAGLMDQTQANFSNTHTDTTSQANNYGGTIGITTNGLPGL